MSYRCGYVALVGRPSVGKSTLLNALCGQKVAITAKTPQTTRNRIAGIVHLTDGQLILVDTPGYHSSSKDFNKRMMQTIRKVLREVDVILYLVDVTRLPGQEESHLCQMLVKHRPLVLALNKIDAGEGYIRQIKETLPRILTPEATVEISGKEGQGQKELLNLLLNFLPEGQALYPENICTDQSPKFRIAEIIREKALPLLTEELPHALYVRVSDISEEFPDSLSVTAFLEVERESQKGIVVGKKGERIKQIRQGSEKTLARVLGYKKVHLDLRVKVDPNWKKKPHRLDFLLS